MSTNNKTDGFDEYVVDLRRPASTAEAMAFVRKKIAHQMARRTWSNRWSEDHIYDAARMLDDWKAHNAELCHRDEPVDASKTQQR